MGDSLHESTSPIFWQKYYKISTDIFTNMISNNSTLILCKQMWNNPKYWDRQAWANSIDSDQMSLHCLSLIQQFLHTIIDS